MLSGDVPITDVYETGELLTNHRLPRWLIITDLAFIRDASN